MRTNNAEGGSNGSAVTAANSGGASGTAWNAVILNGASTLTYSSAWAHDGALSYALITDATATAYLMWTGLASAKCAFRVNFELRANFPTTGEIWLARASGSAGQSFRVTGANTGGINVLRLADADGSQIWQSSAALAVDTDYRLEVLADPIAGSITIAYYAGNSTTALATTTLTGQPLGGGNIENFYLGKYNGVDWTHTLRFDSIAFEQAATGLIGPTGGAGNSVPSADAGAAQTNLEPGATVTLAGTDSDSDGVIVSRVWARTAGPAVTLTGATTRTPTFPAPGSLTDATVTLQYTVTDDDAATASDTVTVGVLSATERAVTSGVEAPAYLLAVSS